MQGTSDIEDEKWTIGEFSVSVHPSGPSLKENYFVKNVYWDSCRNEKSCIIIIIKKQSICCFIFILSPRLSKYYLEIKKKCSTVEIYYSYSFRSPDNLFNVFVIVWIDYIKIKNCYLV